MSMAPGAMLDVNGLPIPGFSGTYNVPAAVTPGAPVLLAASDTGVSSSDGITSLDNSSTAEELQFSVAGTLPGDTVNIYADGMLFGSAIASSTTTIVTTDGVKPLSVGSHSITASQGFSGGQSADSAAVLVSVLGPLALPNPGKFDTGFDFDGINVSSQLQGGDVNAVAIQTDRKILAAGTITQPGSTHTLAGLARYTASGELDPTFATGGILVPPGSSFDQAMIAVALQSDGKILTLQTINGPGFNQVVRYNSNGTLDGTFGTGGSAAINPANQAIGCYSMALQSDGKIVIAGLSLTGNTELVRLTTVGTFDTSFNGTGYVVGTFPGNAYFTSVTVTSDGHIVATGSVAPVDNYRVLIARYTSAGVLDTTFNAVGYVETDIGSTLSTQGAK